MKKTLVASAVLAVAGLAPLAWAGGQQVVAEVSADGRSILVRTFRCGTPSSLSLRGTAEGVVAGQRRTLDLEITRAAEAGVFNVPRQWPAEGKWALVFNVAGGHAVSTLVVLEPGATLRIAEQKLSFEKPSPQRIEAALTSAAPLASSR